ncbi:DNA-binding protein rif1 [Geranomyces michiganensis]|nr:DNA-binding protein rif1 [Geranomyces michiganensis]
MAVNEAEEQQKQEQDDLVLSQPQPPSTNFVAPAPAAGAGAGATIAEAMSSNNSTPTTPSALAPAALAKASLPDLVAALTAQPNSSSNDNQRRATTWWALLQHLRALDVAVPAAPLTPFDKPTLDAVLECFLKDLMVAPPSSDAAARVEPAMILSQCALRAVGYCLYRIQLLANASPDQLRAVFSAVISILTNSADGKMVYLAVWTLAIHRVEPIDMLQDMSEELVRGLMRSLDFVDATDMFMKDFLAALHRLFKKLPEVCLDQAIVWFPRVFPLLLSSDTKTVEYANSFFPPVVEHFISLRKERAAQIKRLAESQLQPATELMQANMTHKNVFTAWGHLVASLGSNLHRATGFNAILKIVESGFNSPADAKRIAAHKAWRRLILNFAHDGHLRTPKRTTLLLLPILNAFRHEKLASARQECAASYVFLLIHLSRFPPATGLAKATLLSAVIALITQTDQQTTKPGHHEATNHNDLEGEEALDDVVAAIACFAGGDARNTPVGAAATAQSFSSSPPDLCKSFAEIDAGGKGAKLFRRRVRTCLPSSAWNEEDFAAVLAIVGMVAGRCIKDPGFRDRAMPLWEGVVAFIDRSVGPPSFSLGPLVEGLNTLWGILQRPDAQDRQYSPKINISPPCQPFAVDFQKVLTDFCIPPDAQALAGTVTIPALKRLHEAPADHQRSQFDRAKQATKLATNIRRMMAGASRAHELMTAVISCIAKQYQSALAPGDPLAGRPHQRAQSIMDKLSSPVKPRATPGPEDHSSPRRGRATGNASAAHTPVHFFPVSEKKRKTLDANDEESLTPKQMEKRRQVNNIPFKMYNGLDRTQSQSQSQSQPNPDIFANDVESGYAEYKKTVFSEDDDENDDNGHGGDNHHHHGPPPPPPLSHDENDPRAAAPAAAAAPTQSQFPSPPPPPPPPPLPLPAQSQSGGFVERPRVNTMPPPLTLLPGETSNPNHTASFSAAVEMLKARTGELAKMHPRELLRVHISLHNIIGELIRVANVNVTNNNTARPE